MYNGGDAVSELINIQTHQSKLRFKHGFMHGVNKQ
jgi:hypothetical protein